jgi:ribosome-binding factor A
MPKEFHRTDRVADMLQMELAALLHQEANDPRFAELTVVEVRVTRDLSHAKVFVSTLDDDPEKVASLQKALKKATGFIRSQIAKRMMLRIVPTMSFILDSTYKKGHSLTSMIESAVESDKKQMPPADEE